MMFEDSTFEFTDAWFTLGIVTPERLAALRTHWAQGDDTRTEHYRWRAFQEFLNERRPLPPELAAALYELGAADRDHAMGSSMMHAIVDLPECPASVLDAAAASGRKHLIRLVERRRARTDAVSP